MVDFTHGKPAHGLLLLGKLFKMGSGWGYCCRTSAGEFLTVRRKALEDNTRWEVALGKAILSDEVNLCLRAPDGMPFLQGPWMMGYLVVMHSPGIPQGSRAPKKAIYLAQTPIPTLTPADILSPTLTRGEA